MKTKIKFHHPVKKKASYLRGKKEERYENNKAFWRNLTLETKSKRQGRPSCRAEHWAQAFLSQCGLWLCSCPALGHSSWRLLMASPGTGLLAHAYFLRGHPLPSEQWEVGALWAVLCSRHCCCACACPYCQPADIAGTAGAASEEATTTGAHPRLRQRELGPVSLGKRRLCGELTTRSVPERVLQGWWAASMVMGQGEMGTNWKGEI